MHYPVMAARQFSVNDVIDILEDDTEADDFDLDEFCLEGSDAEVSEIDRYDIYKVKVHNYNNNITINSDEEMEDPTESEVVSDDESSESTQSQTPDSNDLPWFDSMENKKTGEGYKRQYQNVK